MTDTYRVAFCSDSFHEVNGVALTSRQFHSFAERRKLPFLSVHVGPETRLTSAGTVTTLELARGGASFAVESDLSYDLLFWRHAERLTDAMRAFRPDLVHVTGPGDIGQISAWVAYKLGIPLVASWHTNVHEYAGRRLEKLLSFLPDKAIAPVAEAAERGSLTGAARFYKLARLLFAPNQELVDMLRERTGKPCHLMQRGVDAELYTPAKRTPGERPFTIGYVGRLSPEKNVRLFAEIERTLLEAGQTNFRLLIVGTGSEIEWLRTNLRYAELPGVVRGAELARAYADMDVFAFPSHTDTFGNVILEALASGVPPVVTTGGGPKFLVRSGQTGFVAADDRAFTQCILQLMTDPGLHSHMRQEARAYACSISWDRVFERVYEAYASVVPLKRDAPASV